MVETLDYIDVRERPSITKLSPDEDTHVVRTGDKGVSSCGVRGVSAVDGGLGYPLHACHSLEVTERVTHDGLRRVAYRAVYHYKR